MKQFPGSKILKTFLVFRYKPQMAFSLLEVGFAPDSDSSAVGPQKVQDEPEEGGFARPIRPDDANTFFCRRVERNSLQRRLGLSAVGFPEIFDLDHANILLLLKNSTCMEFRELQY